MERVFASEGNARSSAIDPTRVAIDRNRSQLGGRMLVRTTAFGAQTKAVRRRAALLRALPALSDYINDVRRQLRQRKVLFAAALRSP
jgi:hypothetical protein